MTPYLILSLIFFVAGIVLLAVVAYLALLVRKHRRLLGELLKLAQNDLNPLQLPETAWSALADGGITRLEYSGNWFGQPVQGLFGAIQDGSRPFSFSISANDDILLDFRLYARTHGGETRLFSENLAGVFRLLMETAVHSKMQALSAALAEQARLTLYLQHDLRNLAQWVEWLTADLASTTDDTSLLRLANRLKISAPQAAVRAKQILKASCKVHAKTSRQPQEIALGYTIRQAAEHAGIAIHIKGDARICLRRDLLDRTLDNLFANVATLLRAHPDRRIAVAITHESDKVMARVQIPRLAEIAQLPPEKLFEPFASGRPGGLGLGLYQAHKSLKEAGGDLIAELGEQEIYFLLTLPEAEMAV